MGRHEGGDGKLQGWHYGRGQPASQRGFPLPLPTAQPAEMEKSRAWRWWSGSVEGSSRAKGGQLGLLMVPGRMMMGHKGDRVVVVCGRW